MARKFVTLTYHGVTQQPDALRPGQCHAALFENQLATLKRFFNVLPLARAVELSRQNELPARCVCLSFDDGYLDNYEVALPLLQKAGLPATFFVATGFLDDGVMWNDRIIEAVRRRRSGGWDLAPFGLGQVTLNGATSRADTALQLILELRYLDYDRRDEATRDLLTYADVEPLPQLMMSPANVRALAAAGMDVGGHTVSHPILTKIDEDRARREICDGRDVLREITGLPVSLFAYPNGKPGRDYDAGHAAMVRAAGFDAAFSTAWGYASADSDLYELPRAGFQMDTGWRFAAKLMRTFWERQA